MLTSRFTNDDYDVFVNFKILNFVTDPRQIQMLQHFDVNITSTAFNIDIKVGNLN